jgi:8-oxo-dGTP pyrophosphatase MutT (NUDIX family)
MRISLFKEFINKRPKKDSNLSAKTIAFYRGKILLLKNKDNTFEIPGGHVEKGESYLDGAKREFFEETGIKISNLKILKRAPNRIIYSCKLKTNIVKLSDEHIGFKFINVKDINKIKLNNKAKKDLNIIK